jgi:Gliding motility associated protein GldN
MKKITTTLALVLFVLSSFAQKNHLNEILVRHDTTILKAEECEWVIKPLSKTGETVKSVPLVILQAIQKGKLQAVDPLTGILIPAKEIFTWGRAADTMATIDGSGNMKYHVVQSEHNPENIPLIRIYHDWYFDVSSGNLIAGIKCIELIEEVKTSSGYNIGYRPFCRIYY